MFCIRDTRCFILEDPRAPWNTFRKTLDHNAGQMWDRNSKGIEIIELVLQRTLNYMLRYLDFIMQAMEIQPFDILFIYLVCLDAVILVRNILQDPRNFLFCNKFCHGRRDLQKRIISELNSLTLKKVFLCLRIPMQQFKLILLFFNLFCVHCTPSSLNSSSRT